MLIVALCVCLLALIWLPACQKQEAIAITEQHQQPNPDEQLPGPYEDCLCNEVHALNAKVDKLLDLLDQADWLPPVLEGK